MDVTCYPIAKYDSVSKQFTEDAREFHSPQTITLESPTDDPAVLVWENFKVHLDHSYRSLSCPAIS